MKLQVGPCVVSAKINGSFVKLFDAADVSCNLKTERTNRINDGMIVESVYTITGVTFEIKAREWSIKLLRYLSVFDSYAPSDPSWASVDTTHIFTLTDLGSVSTQWLKFESIRPTKSTSVELPRAMLTGDISFTYPEGDQGDITASGEAQKAPGQPLIILTIASGSGGADDS